jgi:hypothetical protein
MGKETNTNDTFSALSGDSPMISPVDTVYKASIA